MSMLKMVVLEAFPSLLGHLIWINVAFFKFFPTGISFTDCSIRTLLKHNSPLAILETRAIMGCKKIIGPWKYVTMKFQNYRPIELECFSVHDAI